MALAAKQQTRPGRGLRWPTRDQVSFTTRRSITELTPSGMLSIFSSADQFLADQIVLAYEMEESDPDLAGTLHVRRAAVRRLLKNVQPGDPRDERSARAADELDQLVQKGWWGRLEDQLLHATWQQHAAVEVSYDADWMPTGCRAVEPERYYVDDDLNVAMYRDLAAPSSADLVRFEPGSFIHHSHQAIAGQPGRYATVRTLAKLWYLAHLNLTGWGKLIDRWGQPFMHFQYDPATMGEVELRNLVDTFLGLADEMIMASPVGVTADIKDPIEHTPNREFAEFYAKSVSRFLLGQETAQHATAGQETGATVQGQVRDDLRDEDAEALDDTLATQFITPWCGWVFGPTVAPPVLRHVAQTVLDQEQRGRVFLQAQTLGLAIKREQAYDELGIETPAEGDELLVPPAAQSVPAAAAVDNVAFEKRMLELIGQGQMTREMLVNLLDVQEMIRRVGLPLYNVGKGGDAEPWLPILAPPGMAEVTGDVKRDEEGDIVGGDVREPPLGAGGGGFGGLPFARLARAHPSLCRRVDGVWYVRPRGLVSVLYDPNQPRDPGGEGGGQWTKEGGGGKQNDSDGGDWTSEDDGSYSDSGGTITRETEKAILYEHSSGKYEAAWLPKSQIEVDGDKVVVPRWLKAKKFVAKDLPIGGPRARGHFEVFSETEKAWGCTVGVRTSDKSFASDVVVWLPKSQVTRGADGTFHVPRWLRQAKEAEVRESFRKVNGELDW